MSDHEEAAVCDENVEESAEKVLNTPGGTVCRVATCKSNSKKSKEKGENLMFFRFPKDSKIQKE
ncbi:unnamed protein product [Acanthoscelides obtectus]|uniref:Uncharacterized protein n=1 Tax=Acanthoscelides obtectus TaxID=200917 RepID=A0A9P0LEC3_ACAOB|nr:unnamed protein product [Acanthoscelides obtectus]CAK1680613.1 hypothetical protein AOBTE_LOCUS32805 [Acanthoscelides obtectus]